MASNMNVIARKPNSPLNAKWVRIDATLKETGVRSAPVPGEIYAQEYDCDNEPGEEVDTKCIMKLACSRTGRLVRSKNARAWYIKQCKWQPETTVWGKCLRDKIKSG